ncbi:hypothetical protein OIU77_016797 [Salix suchowensis]|uniref:Uncharacterized protein n=1 Tax=Salix suchowensis TaxID=1278906 RepID=A0ABQ8ZLK6_9ROSI|nr:hypothetical protein OIU77_016797 [Salix suchowensis]
MSNNICFWRGERKKPRRAINYPICNDVSIDIAVEEEKYLGKTYWYSKTVCIAPNSFLSHLDIELSWEYNLLLDQEELFWKQKSRNTWLKEGDRNTHFFHLSTIIRRRRNKIEGLQNANGDWVTDMCGMKDVVVNYFHELFSNSRMSGDYNLIPQLFSKLEEADLDGLRSDVSNEKIHQSLFSIGGLKSPRA